MSGSQADLARAGGVLENQGPLGGLVATHHTPQADSSDPATAEMPVLLSMGGFHSPRPERGGFPLDGKPACCEVSGVSSRARSACMKMMRTV